MNGFEYTVASHMIQEGIIDEGLEIVKSIRDRYDGEKRNPWNEFECGSNYARSMASYALLLALSGFEFNLVTKHIGFNPVRTENGKFKCFWSLGTGWGAFEMKPDQILIHVQYGKLEVKTLKLPFLKGRKLKCISLGEYEVQFENYNGEITFSKPISIEKGEKLIIQL